MKGLSLTTDIVILLIIGATLLAVILVFFRGTGGSGMTQFELEQQRSQLCKQYVQMDSDCDGNDAMGRDLLDKETATDLIKVCNRLGGYDCSSDVSCIQNCCSFLCLVTTETTTGTGGSP